MYQIELSFLNSGHLTTASTGLALCHENCMVASLLSCNFQANPLRGTGGAG